MLNKKKILSDTWSSSLWLCARTCALQQASFDGGLASLLAKLNVVPTGHTHVWLFLLMTLVSKHVG
jgi:hypothetical protein